MNHHPSSRHGLAEGPALTPPSHCTFPPRALYTVPEYEAETFAGSKPAQHGPSSILSGHRDGDRDRDWNMRDSSHSWTYPQAQQSRAWFSCAPQKPEDATAQLCRAYQWTTPARLLFHVISFAASLATVTLLAQALISHRKLRHIRQFSGADNAWPKHMSFTASIVLLAAASVNIVKSASSFVVEVYYRTRSHSNRLLIVSTVSSVSMAAIWVAVSVFVEANRRSNEDFATWSCARSEAVFNQIVPYRAICNEEVKLTLTYP
jgi:hypothetical protein